VPIYRQLYEWFRGAILDGRLKPGQRVPSTRTLAAELAISRIPVLNAYEQLRTEGYLDTLVGGGTRIASVIVDEAMMARRPGMVITRNAEEPDAVPRRNPPRGEIYTNSLRDSSTPRFGAFRVGLPALDHFPVAVWGKLIARHSRRMSQESMSYGDAMGYLPLREVIAEYLGAARSVRCDASQILICAGSQQALQLTAQVLLAPDDEIALEEPGYPGAQNAFRSVGARLVAVPVDDEGLDVEALTRLSPTVRAVYITPSHQLPLGMTLSARRRTQLLHWAKYSGAWIMEDDYDSEYRFASGPIGALQGIDRDARVIYLGTFSKVMFPALRLGYIVAPPELVSAFASALDAAGLATSTINQPVLADFIREGDLARHIRRTRVLYMERRQALVNALNSHFGQSIKVVGTEAGMHLVVLLPEGIDDRQMARRAAARGVATVPLSTCYCGTVRSSGLVLGYGGANVAQIREGVRILESCLSDN